MKQLPTWTSFKSIVTFIVLCLTQGMAMAQDSSSSSSSSSRTITTTTTTHSEWYAQPWVWVVGGAVLILLLVALLRGSSSSRTNTGNEVKQTDKVTVTRSSRTDSDV
jgi:hypothetical protein